jgi:hypothetical protein
MKPRITLLLLSLIVAATAATQCVAANIEIENIRFNAVNTGQTIQLLTNKTNIVPVVDGPVSILFDVTDISGATDFTVPILFATDAATGPFSSLFIDAPVGEVATYGIDGINDGTPYALTFSLSSPKGGLKWNGVSNPSFSLQAEHPVPEPATMVLVATGVLGLIAGNRRRRK